jgi:hypothetical protein
VAPARVGSVRDEGVDDGGAACSSGIVRGGSNRRRRPPGTGGSDPPIGLAPASIEVATGAGRSGGEWWSWWCAQNVEGRPPFIGA